MLKDKGDFYQYEDDSIDMLFTKKEANDMSISKNYLNEFIFKNLNNKKIIVGKQIHGNKIKNIYDDIENIYDGYDGFATKRKDVALVCYYADCLPIYLYDKKKEVISLLHSGWRGTYARIIEKGIQNLIDNFDSNISDIHVILGISISQKDYEVSKSFYDDFILKFKQDELNGVFLIKGDKFFFDNRRLNENLALKYGIMKRNIYITQLDVVSANTYSYRLDKETKRAAAIMSFK